MSTSSEPLRLRISTRGSTLALRQVELVVEALRVVRPEVEVEVVTVRTTGDRDQTAPIMTLGDGVFVRGVEAELLEDRADAAVHSAKDMPSDETPGLVVAAYLPRADPRDVLVSRDGRGFEALPAGARLGTGSPRREALARALRPDLDVQPVRGNVDTRLRKLREGQYDALVLAAAGLDRLGIEAQITERLDPERWVPAAGQGIMAVQCRAGSPAAALLAALDDAPTRAASTAERAVLRRLGSGCRTPVGVYGRVNGDLLTVDGMLLPPAGGPPLRVRLTGRPEEAETLGTSLAERLLAGTAGPLTPSLPPIDRFAMGGRAIHPAEDAQRSSPTASANAEAAGDTPPPATGAAGPLLPPIRRSGRMGGRSKEARGPALSEQPQHASETAPQPAPATVYLVGAGPGDPELITVAGMEALRRADVVVYDRLAAPALLREARPEALLIDAGKAPGAHTIAQDNINALLAEHALAGRTVVRLKGGDPFVFGRGGEEALHLRERGIPFRVVPGVTSAIAAAACAGIPVTHRGIASSVLIATGHEAADGPGATFDWDALARAADTLVFLMGVERLSGIADRLVRAGRPAAQPAALVRWGSTTEQTVLSATLGTIAERARAAGFKPPATLIVGEVVALRERLAWLETLPLFGARVLVTRTREQASGLVARLRSLGAVPLEFPAIACSPIAETAELDRAIQALAGQDWVVFTSANGVTAAFERLEALGLDARVFGRARVCAIGPATAAALAQQGIRADLVPPRYTTAEVLTALTGTPEGVAGKRVLLLRADIAPPDLGHGLAAAGALVESIATYRTTAAGGRRKELAELLAGGLDAVTFTASSTVTHLLEVLDGDTSLLHGALVASIGPSTSATARKAGLAVAVEAERHTIDGLVDALAATWARRRSTATGDTP